MPGIAGIISAGGKETLQPVLTRMLQAMARQPEWRTDSYVDELAALGQVGFRSPETYLCQTDGMVAAATGHLVQRDRITRSLREPVSSSANLARLLLALYQEHGLEGVLGLNGSYTLAVWEPRHHKLLVVKDRWGYASNMYYWHTPNQILFASEIKSIAWHPQFDQAVDEVGIADLFINLCPLQERTLFANIHALGGAQYLVYQDNHLAVNTYWKPTYFVPGTAAQRPEEYVDEMVFHLKNAVERRIYPESALLVTGGLDARTLAGFYHRLAPELPLKTVTIGKDTGQDYRIGVRVARAVGAEHHRIPLDDHYLETYAPLSAWRAEGKMPGYASWIFAAEPYLKEQGLQYAMTGLFGNFVSGRHYPPGLWAASSFEEQEKIVREMNRSLVAGLRQVMLPEVFERASPNSIETHVETYRCSGAFHALNRFDHVVLKSLMERAANGADALGDAVSVVDPFVDNDLLDFTFGMPPEVRANPSFYLSLIVRHLPDMARIPHGRTDYPVSVDLWLSEHHVFQKMDYLRRRATKKLFPQWMGDEARGCIPYNDALTHGTHSLVEEHLVQGAYLDDLFDVNAIRQMVNNQRMGRGKHLYSPLTTLLTIGLFRKQMRALQ